MPTQFPGLRAGLETRDESVGSSGRMPAAAGGVAEAGVMRGTGDDRAGGSRSRGGADYPAWRGDGGSNGNGNSDHDSEEEFAIRIHGGAKRRRRVVSDDDGAAR